MNNFATALKTLLSRTGVKHATVAQAVRYDESYISKWLSGRIVPTQRNIEKISAEIAGCVVAESSDAVKAALYEDYDVYDDEALVPAVAESLLTAYYGGGQALSEGFSADEPTLSVVRSLTWKGSTVTMLVDLLSLEHESRLLLAGIQDGHFQSTGARSGTLNMVICLDSLTDPVYDPIFLVHLLTSCSRLDLRLYGNQKAAGKFLYSDGESQVVTAVLADTAHCLAVTRNRDAAPRMFRDLSAFCTQETLLFQRMDSLLENHMYMQSLLSAELQWLTGHFTEQMVPAALFDALCTEMPEEVQRIRNLLPTAVPRAQLLIYRSAFSKLMISGELDFFNRRVLLDQARQLQVLRYVRHLAETGQVRIVDGGFSLDFQYITDPCVFLSDTVDYLRLENGRYEDNLLSIAEKQCRSVFHRFFAAAWDAPGIVIREKGEVLSLIDSYISQLELLL